MAENQKEIEKEAETSPNDGDFQLPETDELPNVGDLMDMASGDLPDTETGETSAQQSSTSNTSAQQSSGLDEMTTEAINMLSQGKRNMVCGEVPQAVNQFQEACRLFAKKFGETANECGEAYLCYGKALLELSRMESGVLGNALDGIEDEEDSSEKSSEKSSEDDKVEDPEKCTGPVGPKLTEKEKEEIFDQVIDAMVERKEEVEEREKKEKAKEEKVLKEKNVEIKDGEKVEKKDEKEKEGKENDEEAMETEEKDGEAESEDLGTEEEGTEEEGTEEEGEEVKEGEDAKEGEVKEGEKKEGETSKEKEKEEDDVSNLQLAWEMLELAKVIYRRCHSRDQSKENRLKLAEAHLKLGEVGLETEQYDTSIMDFKECLKIQKDTLEANDRLLAETYYQLGLACTYATQYDDAISSYKQASKVIESKIEALADVIKANEDRGDKGKEIADWDDPVYKANKEINELKDILPDIMAKIDDVLDEQKSAEKATKMVKETVAAELPVKEDGKDATNISHLVRKKRKTDEESPVNPKEAKVEGKGDHAHVNGSK